MSRNSKSRLVPVKDKTGPQLVVRKELVSVYYTWEEPKMLFFCDYFISVPCKNISHF